MKIRFKRVHTTKGLAISAAVLAAGVALYFVNKGLGFTIGVCGLAMMLFYRPAFRREGDGTLLRKAAFDVASSCREQLVAYLGGKADDLKLDQPSGGGVVRLETYYNAKTAVAYAQVFDFSSYAYVPATAVTELHGERAGRLIAEIGAYLS